LQIISVKIITLSKRNCKSSKNWSPPKVYIIHPNFILSGSNDLTFKRVNLEFTAALNRKSVENAAISFFWVIRASWKAPMNPVANTIAPTTIDVAVVESSLYFLCMQLVLPTTENNIKLPQQACRAIDDKCIPGCSTIKFHMILKHMYSWNSSLIPVETIWPLHTQKVKNLKQEKIKDPLSPLAPSRVQNAITQEQKNCRVMLKSTRKVQITTVQILAAKTQICTHIGTWGEWKKWVQILTRQICTESASKSQQKKHASGMRWKHNVM